MNKYQTISVNESFVKMPHLSFYQKELLVIRISLCALSFRDKLCAKITDKELEAAKDIETGNIVNRTLIRKMWDACLKYEYVSQSYDFMGSFVDKIILK